jgi:nicotinamide-nucleotide amidase
VGLVWFAWAARGGELRSESHRFEGDRAAVRLQSVRHALEGLIRMMP